MGYKRMPDFEIDHRLGLYSFLKIVERLALEHGERRLSQILNHRTFPDVKSLVKVLKSLFKKKSFQIRCGVFMA